MVYEFLTTIESLPEKIQELTSGRYLCRWLARELVEKEDKKKPFSDERLAQLLEEDGILVSRRTVAKYRMELGIGGVFQRKA